MLLISEGRMAEGLTYEGVTMVAVDFRYPVVSGGSPKADRRINRYYRHIARTLLRRARSELLPAAVDEWRYSVENSCAFHPFETAMEYTATQNGGDILSLYYDVRDDTGSGRGVTKRFGDTWRASSGWFAELDDFFPRGTNCKRVLVDNAVKIAAGQTDAGTHRYFDDYPKLIKKYYSPMKFYVSGDTVTIFYDQFAIAPRSEGIPAFDYKIAVDTE